MTDVPDSSPRLRLDRAALRMLAHPLRSRLLAELRLHGPATATTLAARLQTNSGATSYHLRKPRRRRGGRGQRRGHAAGHGSGPRAASGRAREEDARRTRADGDDDAAAALAWLARDYLQHFSDRAGAWLEDQDRWPAPWRERRRPVRPPGAGDPGAAGRTAPELEDVLQRYRRVGAGNPECQAGLGLPVPAAGGPAAALTPVDRRQRARPAALAGRTVRAVSAGRRPPPCAPARSPSRRPRPSGRP